MISATIDSVSHKMPQDHVLIPPDFGRIDILLCKCTPSCICVDVKMFVKVYSSGSRCFHLVIQMSSFFLTT